MEDEHFAAEVLSIDDHIAERRGIDPIINHHGQVSSDDHIAERRGIDPIINHHGQVSTDDHIAERRGIDTIINHHGQVSTDDHIAGRHVCNIHPIINNRAQLQSQIQNFYKRKGSPV